MKVILHHGRPVYSGLLAVKSRRRRHGMWVRKTHLVHHQHCVGQLGILQLVGDQHHHTAAQHTLQAHLKQPATNDSVHRTEGVIQQVHISSTINCSMCARFKMVRDTDVWTLNYSQLEKRARQDTDYAVIILESTAQKDGDRGKRTIDWARTRDLQYTLSWSFSHEPLVPVAVVNPSSPIAHCTCRS